MIRITLEQQPTQTDPEIITEEHAWANENFWTQKYKDHIELSQADDDFLRFWLVDIKQEIRRHPRLRKVIEGGAKKIGIHIDLNQPEY